MPVKDLVVALGVTLLWGFNFSLIRYCLNFFDPFTLAGIRFALCAFPCVFFVRRPDVPLGWVVGYGLLFGVGTWGLVNLGVVSGVSPGVASVLLQTSALFTVLMGALFLGEGYSARRIGGMLLSMTGVIVLFNIQDQSITLAGGLMIIGGALFWGLANIVLKRSGTKDNLVFFIWSCSLSPLPLFFLGVNNDHLFDVRSPDSIVEILGVVVSLLLTAYVATIYCYTVWNRLLVSYDLALVVPLSFMVPVFGLLASHLLFDEPIGMMKIIGVIIVISGVYFAMKNDRAKVRV